MESLLAWSTQTASRKLLQAEKICLAPHLAELRGYHLMLSGAHRSLSDLPAHCLHAFGLSPAGIRLTDNNSWVQADFTALPLREGSIDGVILPYILDYCISPEILLKEISRALITDGKLYLFGFQRFHPWCWFNAPKSATPLPLWSVKSLLTQTDFLVGEWQWLQYGAVYFIKAQKQITMLNPIKPQWQALLRESPLAQPTAERTK